MRLSLLIICQNEERRIGRALQSVRGVADEIVAVDGGSSDGTLRLLEEAGARVIRRPYDGTNRQKQAGLECCRGDYVLNLDADEELSPELAAEIARTDLAAAPAWRIAFVTLRNGTVLRRWRREYHVRLFRRGSALYDTSHEPHDRLLTDGPVNAFRHPVLHHSFGDWVEYEKRAMRYARLSAMAMRNRGQRATAADEWLRPAWKYFKVLLADGWVLSGADGFSYARLAAAETRWKYHWLRKGGPDTE
ncbi:MAG: hypothetical protein GMKNLPBB_00943 [Myxococcota bacterium]|nr:hypothetical protein [Myxococcota bacterium]